MTTLTFQTLEIPGADWGEKNCLPDIFNNPSLHSRVQCSPNITEADKDTFDQLRIHTMLPYQLQSMYDRGRNIQTFTAAVLENEYLIATFLPEMGGRLWSLFHKKENKELLYVNDVFQPANLALRNAWFAGGVEWNCGVRGHAPLTCSPLFAERAVNKEGAPVLKMYEYERITGVSYSICATLKDDVLLVHNTIENTQDQDKWTYWWSNIAVEETPQTRVIVPAQDTFYCGYREGVHVLDAGPYPYTDQLAVDDLSYPSRYDQTWDMFFKVPPEEDKWIASVEGDGKGLAQFSTPILYGRKLFAWGSHPGGRNWNRWLSDSGRNYIEIQAGLRHTQQEVVRIQGNSKLQWTEGYCMVSADPAVLHGADYSAAVNALSEEMHQRITGLDETCFEFAEEAVPVLAGSGWGALENRMRTAPVSSTCTFAPSTMNEEQADWLALLDQQQWPAHDPLAPIVSYAPGSAWIPLLEKLPGKDWYVHYHLGVLHYQKGDAQRAEEHFQISARLQPNPWALRCLSRMERSIKKDLTKAAEYMLQAMALKADYLPLTIECVSILVESGSYDDLFALYERLDETSQANGRVQMLLALAYTRTGQLEAARKILTPELCVPDVKEGEYSISHYWAELYGRILAQEMGRSPDSFTVREILERYPLPQRMDFRQDI